MLPNPAKQELHRLTPKSTEEPTANKSLESLLAGRGICEVLSAHRLESGFLQYHPHQMLLAYWPQLTAAGATAGCLKGLSKRCFSLTFRHCFLPTWVGWGFPCLSLANTDHVHAYKYRSRCVSSCCLACNACGHTAGIANTNWLSGGSPWQGRRVVNVCTRMCTTVVLAPLKCVTGHCGCVPAMYGVFILQPLEGVNK